MTSSPQTTKPPAEPASHEPRLLVSEERVLSTLEADGSRRWLKPRLSPGRFLTRRRFVAYGLIALFTLLPYIHINGKPAILLDVINREFTFFGLTFAPTETVLLALLMVSILVSVFLLTALFGRVWCGWACPQTVYMEYVYRPIERLFEGTTGRGGTAKHAVAGWRRVARIIVYAVISFYLAHTFLAYFVGVANLRQWIFGSPFDHPVAFLVVMAVTGLMMFDFVYFREQLCIVACPYGRLQSVLLDRFSLIVGYDRKRGEPRGKKKSDDTGDCIDCKMCVITCPTGIDIRDGLQLECIGCAQCIDACDTVMDKIDRPRGLIRYSSQAAMEDGDRRVVRPRVVLYPAILAIVLTLLAAKLATREAAQVHIMKMHNNAAQFVVNDGLITNRLLIEITNRTETERVYAVSVVDEPRVTARMTEQPMTVGGGEMKETGLIIDAEPGVFSDGYAVITLRITDGNRFDQQIQRKILGPFNTGATP